MTFFAFFVTHLSKVSKVQPRRLPISWIFQFFVSCSITLALPTISCRPTTVNAIPCQHASSMSSYHRVHTKWQGPLSGVHSITMEKLAQPGEGGGSTPNPFYYIYHHVHSCGVRSSWEDIYTTPISTLSLCSSSYSTQHSGTATHPSRRKIPSSSSVWKGENWGQQGGRGGHFTLLTSGSHRHRIQRSPMPNIGAAQEKIWEKFPQLTFAHAIEEN